MPTIRGVSIVFTCLVISTCYVPSVGTYCSLLSVALSVWLQLFVDIQVLLASVGFAKDAPHNNGQSNENCCNIIILLHSLCVNDKMEPCSDMNSLMWCIMHVQCIYGVRYILSLIDADKSINRCLCLHLKHLHL